MMNLKIELVSEIHRNFTYKITYGENGNDVECTATVTPNTFTFSNDLLPVVVREFVQKYLSE